MKKVILLSALAALLLAVGVVSAHPDPKNPWPWTSSRSLSVSAVSGTPSSPNLRLVEADRLFTSFTSAETRGDPTTEYHDRRVYVVSNQAYDVVDAACAPQHGNAYVTDVAQRTATGDVIVVRGMSVEGSSAICSALALKVR